MRIYRVTQEFGFENEILESKYFASQECADKCGYDWCREIEEDGTAFNMQVVVASYIAVDGGEFEFERTIREYEF